MCLRYEEIKNQIKKLLKTAEANREAVESDEAWNYWNDKAVHLINALTEIERAQYQKKPGMN